MKFIGYGENDYPIFKWNILDRAMVLLRKINTCWAYGLWIKVYGEKAKDYCYRNAVIELEDSFISKFWWKHPIYKEKF